MYCVCSDDCVSIAILDVRPGGEHLVHPRAVTDPLQIDHVGGPVERGVARNLVVTVGLEVRPRSPALTGVLCRLRLDRGMIVSCASAFEECADAICQPEASQYLAHGPRQACGQ